MTAIIEIPARDVPTIADLAEAVASEAPELLK